MFLYYLTYLKSLIFISIIYFYFHLKFNLDFNIPIFNLIFLIIAIFYQFRIKLINLDFSIYV